MRPFGTCRKIGFVSAILATIIAAAGCGMQVAELHPDLPSVQTKHKTNLRSSSTFDVRPITPFFKTSELALSRPTVLRRPTVPVRAIYVSGNVARSQRMNKLISLVDQTELNAMVLDVNSGFSIVRYPPGRMGVAQTRSASRLKQIVKELKRHHIYLIARIVTFKDPALAKAMPSWAIMSKRGGAWTDHSGTMWIDPFREEAWNYPLKVAEEAVKMGFDEIQFDYVRFPENGAKVDREASFHNMRGWSKKEAIHQFLHRASERVHRAGAYVSADVFGLVASPGGDVGIGQSWRTIATEVDVISPMVYPSHYSKGIWGIAQPDLSPGPIVAHALQDAAKQNRKLNDSGYRTAQVRPWLQSFTAGWVHPHQKYGPAQIREQIQAARRAGAANYLLWNASSRYAIVEG